MAYDGRYYTRGWAWQLTICVARLQRASQQITEDTIPDYEHDNLPTVWLVYRGHYSRWRKILYRGWAWQLTICVARLQRALQQMTDDTTQRMSMTTYHLCGSFTEGVAADNGRYYTEDEHGNIPSVWLVYKERYSRWRKILYRGWAWQLRRYSRWRKILYIGWAWQLTICVARLQRALQQMT